MKKNLAKLYAGINTIIYVNDARTYRYWDEKNDSKECIISPLDVENVIGDLKVCDNSVSVSQYNYHVYLKWLISEEYIESTPELIKGYNGNNMLIFLKHIPENGYNCYYLVYVRVVIPPTPTEGTIAIVSFHKASKKYNRYLYINRKGEELKSSANMSELYSEILSIYVCENLYNVAQENNDRERLYYYHDIEYFEQHSEMVKRDKPVHPIYNSWLSWQWKQVYELKHELLSDFQIQYVESYGRLGIDRYTIDDRSIHDVINRLMLRIEEIYNNPNCLNKERKLNWLSDYPDLDTNYKVYKKLLDLQLEDYKGYIPVKYFERTLGYILVFKNDEKFYVIDSNCQGKKKYEMHIYIDTICPLCDGETDAGISIHFYD